MKELNYVRFSALNPTKMVFSLNVLLFQGEPVFIYVITVDTVFVWNGDVGLSVLKSSGFREPLFKTHMKVKSPMKPLRRL